MSKMKKKAKLKSKVGISIFSSSTIKNAYSNFKKNQEKKKIKQTKLKKNRKKKKLKKLN